MMISFAPAVFTWLTLIIRPHVRAKTNSFKAALITASRAACLLIILTVVALEAVLVLEIVIAVGEVLIVLWLASVKLIALNFSAMVVQNLFQTSLRHG